MNLHRQLREVQEAIVNGDLDATSLERLEAAIKHHRESRKYPVCPGCSEFIRGEGHRHFDDLTGHNLLICDEGPDLPWPDPDGRFATFVTCPACGSSGESVRTPCSNLLCPSHARAGRIYNDEGELLSGGET